MGKRLTDEEALGLFGDRLRARLGDRLVHLGFYPEQPEEWRGNLHFRFWRIVAYCRDLTGVRARSEVHRLRYVLLNNLVAQWSFTTVPVDLDDVPAAHREE